MGPSEYILAFYPFRAVLYNNKKEQLYTNEYVEQSNTRSKLYVLNEALQLISNCSLYIVQVDSTSNVSDDCLCNMLIFMFKLSVYKNDPLVQLVSIERGVEVVSIFDMEDSTAISECVKLPKDRTKYLLYTTRKYYLGKDPIYKAEVLFLGDTPNSVSGYLYEKWESMNDLEILGLDPVDTVVETLTKTGKYRQVIPMGFLHRFVDEIEVNYRVVPIEPHQYVCITYPSEYEVDLFDKLHYPIEEDQDLGESRARVIYDLSKLKIVA